MSSQSQPHQRLVRSSYCSQLRLLATASVLLMVVDAKALAQGDDEQRSASNGIRSGALWRTPTVRELSNPKSVLELARQVAELERAAEEPTPIRLQRLAAARYWQRRYGVARNLLQTAATISRPTAALENDMGAVAYQIAVTTDAPKEMIRALQHSLAAIRLAPDRREPRANAADALRWLGATHRADWHSGIGGLPPPHASIMSQSTYSIRTTLSVEDEVLQAEMQTKYEHETDSPDEREKANRFTLNLLASYGQVVAQGECTEATRAELFTLSQELEKTHPGVAHLAMFWRVSCSLELERVDSHAETLALLSVVPISSKLLRLKLHRMAAHTAGAEGRLRVALEHLAAALELSLELGLGSETLAIQIRRADVLERSGDYEGALVAAIRATRSSQALEPRAHCEALELLVSLLVETQPTVAVELALELQESIQLLKNEAHAATLVIATHFHLSRALGALGEAQLSRTHFAEALFLSEDLPENHRRPVLRNFERHVAIGGAASGKESVNRLEAAIETHSQPNRQAFLPELRLALAKARALSSDWNGAIRDFQLAVEEAQTTLVSLGEEARKAALDERYLAAAAELSHLLYEHDRLNESFVVALDSNLGFRRRGRLGLIYQQELPHDSAILTWSTLASRTLGYLAFHDRVSVKLLESQTIASEVSILANLLAINGGRQDIQELAGHLSDLLLGPFGEELQAVRTLYLVVDDTTSRIPFALLPHPTRAGVLVESVSLVRLRPPALLPKGSDSTPLPLPAARLLVLADPLLPGQYEPLPATRRHLHPATLPYPITLLSGPDATPAQLFQELKQATSLHIATHLDAFEGDRALLMAGLDSSSLSPLLPKDLSAANLSHLHFVFLAACQSSVAKRAGRAHSLDFVDAALAAGANSVVASPANLEDHAAARFSAHFYQSLFSRPIPEDALAHTQSELASAGGHPSLWSTYQVYRSGFRQFQPK